MESPCEPPGSISYGVSYFIKRGLMPEIIHCLVVIMLINTGSTGSFLVEDILGKLGLERSLRIRPRALELNKHKDNGVTARKGLGGDVPSLKMSTRTSHGRSPNTH